MKTLMEMLNWTACAGMFFLLLVNALAIGSGAQMWMILSVALVYLFGFVYPILAD